MIYTAQTQQGSVPSITVVQAKTTNADCTMKNRTVGLISQAKTDLHEIYIEIFILLFEKWDDDDDDDMAGECF